MRLIILAILATFFTTSVNAEMGDRNGRHRRGEHRDHRRGHGDYRDDHRRDRRHRPPRHGRRHRHPRPPVVRPPYYPPIVVRPPVYYPPQPYYPPYRVQIQNCGSINYYTNYCHTNMREIRRISLYRQFSNAPCIWGRTFGINGNAIFVTNGCQGQFRIEGY